MSDIEEIRAKWAEAPEEMGSGRGCCGPYIDHRVGSPDWPSNDAGREPLWLGGTVDDDTLALLGSAQESIAVLLSALDAERAQRWRD